MIRTQVQLEAVQYKALKELAARRSISVSQLVRDGVSHALSQEFDDEAEWDRLFEAVGSCQSEGGESDVSERHDDYLAEPYS